MSKICCLFAIGDIEFEADFLYQRCVSWDSLDSTIRNVSLIRRRINKFCSKADIGLKDRII
jgi:hypothetical protein